MCVALGPRADWAPCRMPEVRGLQSDTGAVLTHLVLELSRLNNYQKSKSHCRRQRVGLLFEKVVFQASFCAVGLLTWTCLAEQVVSILKQNCHLWLMT